MFFLQHPLILEQRRNKLNPQPPQITEQPIVEQPPPPKIKNTVRKKNTKDIKIEKIEEKEEQPKTRRKTKTLKNKVSFDVQPEETIEDIDINKKISAIKLSD